MHVNSQTVPDSFSILELTPAKRRRTALYLFAGEARKSDIPACLSKFNWNVISVDILRSAKDDLTIPATAQGFLERIKAAEFEALLASPPCDTFTRVMFANRLGPPPLRTIQHLRGLPNLSPSRKKKAMLANYLCDFTWTALLLQAETAGLLVAEFPEDLGAAAAGEWKGTRPASFWQFPQFQELLGKPGVHTLGLRQSDFSAPYVKPTRLVVRAHMAPATFFPGAPVFDSAGFYTGPIPKTDFKTAKLITLAKKPGETGFRTTGTAAWADEMCSWVANSINQSSTASVEVPAGEVAANFSADVSKEGLIRGSTKSPPGDSPPKSRNGLSHFDRTAIQFNEKAPYFPNLRLTATPGPPVPLTETDLKKEPPRVLWWTGGRGKPRTTFLLGRERQYNDGAGLTSQGRWDQDSRIFPTGRRWESLRAELFGCITRDLTEMGIQRLCMKLACGTEEEIFSDKLLKDGRKILHSWVNRQCGDYDLSEPEVAAGQPFLLNLMSHLLKEMADPDHAILQEMKSGVTAGILHEMPRTPMIYEQQTKWRLVQDPLSLPEMTSENYKSIEGHQEAVEKMFKEDQAAGRMEELTMAEMNTRFGPNIAINSLAVLEERDKIRVLTDGTHTTLVNHRIRCKDKVRMPGAREKEVLPVETVPGKPKDSAINPR